MIEQPHGLVATLPGDERALSAESVPLTGVRIDVTARGTASAVSVAQRYVNREKVPVEAVYSFPLEEQAAVCGFEAQIGERRIVGHVEEAEAAFEAYDQAMAEGHGAYLLDEDRPNLFTASIGNLLPGQQAVVTVRYVAPLERLGERIRLKVPTTVAPRYIAAEQLRRMDPSEFDHLYPPMVSGGVPYGLALAIDFEGASDVLAVECASHPAQVRVHGPRAHVELSGADVQLDQDVVVSFELATAGATTAQAACDERGDIVVMLDVQPPSDERRAPVEAVFLLDRSGSMTGSSIGQARNALLLALSSLEHGDLFNVYGFGSRFESVFPAPAPYDDIHLDEARRAVQGWDADLGGTELLGPLREIVGRPAGELSRRVLLLTDGEVANEEECADLVERHAAGTTVFTIGIGYGASDYLVGTLARASRGRAETVHPNERIEPVVMRQMARLRTAGLRDVYVDWAGLPVDLAAPATLPPLYPGTPLTVYGRVPAAAVGLYGVFEPAVVATGPDGPVRLAATVDLRGARPDEAIPRLFAREAIRDLEEGRAGAEHHGSRQRARTQKRVDEAVRDLATRYTLMSSQTSFVAVEVREAEAADLPAAELRRIPVALLKDWHGTGGMWAGPSMMTMASMMMPAAGAAPSAPPPTMARYAGRRAAFGPPPGAGFMPRVDGAAGGPHFDATWSQDSAPADPLVELVAGQRADGGWPWSDELLAVLGRSRDECLALLADLGLSPGLAGQVAPTLLVLGLLRRDFAEREGEWRLLADKALGWLANRGVTPPTEAVSLEVWAAARLSV